MEPVTLRMAAPEPCISIATHVVQPKIALLLTSRHSIIVVHDGPRRVRVAGHNYRLVHTVVCCRQRARQRHDPLSSYLV